MRTETELVTLAKAGDMQAFSRLVEQNSDKMYGAAYRILKSKELAEDCVQEAFLKVHLKINTFNEQSKFSTWLYTITVNVALDLLRKNAKHSLVKDHDFSLELAPEKTRPEHIASNKDIAAFTQHAINQLNTDVRIAFVLRHYEGRSIEEISQMLDLNISTVKSRIFRAVGRLRTILKNKVGDYETVD